jgi:predicted SAM-dependent methyltransferase
MSAPRLLNFGCGATFHRDWVNLDAAARPGVVAHDVRRGFPFSDNAFHAVYGSHVLEHLEAETARLVLRECARILRPGGIARIVVPDLEAIARLYLESLEGAAAGDAESAMRYDWAMLELYDQVARTTSGGKMAAYMQSLPVGRPAQFVRSRVGDEALDAARGARRPAVPGLRALLAQACAFLFLGPQGTAALREGLFRRSGEVHLWMYDRFSLMRELHQAGFADLRVCAADESAIAGFAGYGLETANGRARKPDSLYVEGRKPG